MRPLYRQVADEFIARIISGEWSQGQPIDNETEIARSLGVSVGTARKAFDILVEYQLLERQQGRGSVVPELSRGAGRARFSNVRAPCGSRVTGEVEVRDARVERPDERAAALLDVAAGTQIVVFDRLRTYRDRVFMTERVFLRLPGDHDVPGDAEALRRLAEMRWHGFDIATGKSERVGTTRAAAEDAAVFGIDEGHPVMTLERVVRSYRGRPLELRLARCVLEPDLVYAAE
ncbi:hypothetical protein ASG48_05445 [Aurantimonas sp. Leaf443]|nr:hypothetical protein ASG48_05445 [Aurantimonas sp. Leaf443]